MEGYIQHNRTVVGIHLRWIEEEVRLHLVVGEPLVGWMEGNGIFPFFSYVHSIPPTLHFGQIVLRLAGSAVRGPFKVVDTIITCWAGDVGLDGSAINGPL